MKNNELIKFERELWDVQLRLWRAEDNSNKYVVHEEEQHIARVWEIVSDLRKNNQ